MIRCLSQNEVTIGDVSSVQAKRILWIGINAVYVGI